MELITDLATATSDTRLRPCAATIGFFDGVHLGHRYLIGLVREAAAARSLASLVITFPVHPRKVMQAGYQPRMLSSFDEKCTLLADTGVDYCAALPFTRELAAYSAREFMQMLYDRLQVRALVIGYDHRFGRNRSEGFAEYCRYGDAMGMEVLRAEAYERGGASVSSSVVRLLLEEGEVALAAGCLGYNYALTGRVIGGQQIGRTLGYPTANIEVADGDKLIPADGVYAVRVSVGSQTYKGMLNIGLRPTIEAASGRTIEVHLLHFEGNLYDTLLRVEFVARIRGEQKFPTREALAARLQEDAREAEWLNISGNGQTNR